MKDEVAKEGVVLKLASGELVKVKTQWWLDKENYRYCRWLNVQHRAKEQERAKFKRSKMQVQELRAMVKGWSALKSPALLFKMVPTAVKIEAFFARTSGKRGAIVMSFRSELDKANAMMQVHDLFSISDAYSCKSSSNSWHRIRTWYPSAI